MKEQKSLPYEQNDFSIEKLYQDYLKLVSLSEDKMHPAQRIETKRAFFAACGQMIILMRDDIAMLSVDEAAQQIKDLLDEAGNYFLNEMNRKN